MTVVGGSAGLCAGRDRRRRPTAGETGSAGAVALKARADREEIHGRCHAAHAAQNQLLPPGEASPGFAGFRTRGLMMAPASSADSLGPSADAEVPEYQSGGRLDGVEAAARTYFGSSAAALGPRESALLAGAIINPRVLNPAKPTARLARRQQLILSRMGGVALPVASPTRQLEPPAAAGRQGPT